MKCISILQPWASLVALGHKRIETRSWNTKYRGELLIHASKKKPTDPYLYDTLHDIATNAGLIRNWSELPYGAIIGKVNLNAVVDVESFLAFPVGYYGDHRYELTEQELAFGDYSPNRFGWLLSDPILFKEPIPCKGQLGIWNLPAELEELIINQNK